LGVGIKFTRKTTQRYVDLRPAVIKAAIELV